MLVSLLAAVVITRKISPKWYERIEDTTLVGNEPSECQNEPNKGIVEWVSELAKMENCDPLGTMDSDKTLSYGKYCYKPSTFLHFVRKYGLLPEAEDQEVQNWINDNEFQDRLTLLIIENEPESWTHWRNSVLVYKGREGIGLPPNI